MSSASVDRDLQVVELAVRDRGEVVAHRLNQASCDAPYCTATVAECSETTFPPRVTRTV